MRTVPVYFDPAVLQHDTGLYHPDTANRLEVVVEALRQDGRRIEAPPAPDRTLKAVERVHDPAYVLRLSALCRNAPADYGGPFALFDPRQRDFGRHVRGVAARRVAHARRDGRGRRRARGVRLRGGAPAGAPCARVARDGLLLPEFDRDRREGPDRASRRRARPRGRLRRASRERRSRTLSGTTGAWRTSPCTGTLLSGHGRGGRGARGAGAGRR